MLPQRCCIAHCKCKKKNCKMFCFPRNKHLRILWFALMKPYYITKSDVVPQRRQVICQHHFESKYLKNNGTRRKCLALPTLFTAEEIELQLPTVNPSKLNITNKMYPNNEHSYAIEVDPNIRHHDDKIMMTRHTIKHDHGYSSAFRITVPEEYVKEAVKQKLTKDLESMITQQDNLYFNKKQVKKLYVNILSNKSSNMDSDIITTQKDEIYSNNEFKKNLANKYSSLENLPKEKSNNVVTYYQPTFKSLVVNKEYINNELTQNDAKSSVLETLPKVNSNSIVSYNGKNEESISQTILINHQKYPTKGLSKKNPKKEKYNSFNKEKSVTCKKGDKKVNKKPTKIKAKLTPQAAKNSVANQNNKPSKCFCTPIKKEIKLILDLKNGDVPPELPPELLLHLTACNHSTQETDNSLDTFSNLSDDDNDLNNVDSMKEIEAMTIHEKLLPDQDNSLSLVPYENMSLNAPACDDNNDSVTTDQNDCVVDKQLIQDVSNTGDISTSLQEFIKFNHDRILTNVDANNYTADNINDDDTADNEFTYFEDLTQSDDDYVSEVTENQHGWIDKSDTEETSDQYIAIVTTDNGCLSEYEAYVVMDELKEKILESAKTSSTSIVPIFKGKPVVGGGALKLWCEDLETLIWLQDAVAKSVSLRDKKLIVKLQCDLPSNVYIKISIPECTFELKEVLVLLKLQNLWANVGTWIVSVEERQRDSLHLTFSIPFNIACDIMNKGYKLAFGLGSLDVTFANGANKRLEQPGSSTTTNYENYESDSTEDEMAIDPDVVAALTFDFNIKDTDPLDIKKENTSTSIEIEEHLSCEVNSLRD